MYGMGMMRNIHTCASGDTTDRKSREGGRASGTSNIPDIDLMVDKNNMPGLE